MSHIFFKHASFEAMFFELFIIFVQLHCGCYSYVFFMIERAQSHRQYFVMDTTGTTGFNFTVS
jgi:hypothetical protein